MVQQLVQLLVQMEHMPQVINVYNALQPVGLAVMDLLVILVELYQEYQGLREEQIVLVRVPLYDHLKIVQLMNVKVVILAVVRVQGHLQIVLHALALITCNPIAILV